MAIATLSPKQVIESGKFGYYWWRFKAGWDWRPVEVRFKNGEWLAGNQTMDCPQNRILEIKGEFVGPIEMPDDKEERL